MLSYVYYYISFAWEDPVEMTASSQLFCFLPNICISATLADYQVVNGEQMGSRWGADGGADVGICSLSITLPTV